MQLTMVAMGLGILYKVFSISYKMYGWNCLKQNPKPKLVAEEIIEVEAEEETCSKVTERLLSISDRICQSKLFIQLVYYSQKLISFYEYLQFQWRWYKWRKHIKK